MAIEDAAALGIIFSREYFSGNIADALEVYQKVRLPRATRVQAAAAKAAYNINERIGKCILPHEPVAAADTRRILAKQGHSDLQGGRREEKVDD